MDAVNPSRPTKIGHIHIPKTGGASIKRWMDVNGIDHVECGHKTFNEKKNLADWWFTTVRNPYRRMVSFYEFFEKKAKKELGWGRKPQRFPLYHKMLELYDKGFEKWLEGAPDVLWYFPMTQYQWITAEDGSQPDLIIKLEELDQHWHILQEKLGCHEPPYKINVTEKKKSSMADYYTPRAKQMVLDYFREDFEQFGYDQDEI